MSNNSEKAYREFMKDLEMEEHDFSNFGDDEMMLPPLDKFLEESIEKDLEKDLEDALFTDLEFLMDNQLKD